MSNAMPVVFVVDDDDAVRESLNALIRIEGWRAETFASAGEFLTHPRSRVPSCLILDVSLPDLDGLEVQTRVVTEHRDLPIIFITGYGSIPLSVRAMKAGATEFLTKPCDDEVLVSAIRQSLRRSEAALTREAELRLLRERYATLSRREREVMELIVDGRLNKQAGGELGISEITVKAHRGKVMRKMQATSLPDLVTKAARLRDFL